MLQSELIELLCRSGDLNEGYIVTAKSYKFQRVGRYLHHQQEFFHG